MVFKPAVKLKPEFCLCAQNWACSPEVEGNFEIWKSCVGKNKGGGGDSRFRGGYFKIFFSKLELSHPLAVSDLTKAAGITKPDDCEDDYQYEEVTY